MIIVNFKNYKTGEEALKLGKRLSRKTGFIAAVNFLDIQELSKTGLSIFAQHVDCPFPQKKATGFVFPDQLKESGAKGTLLNHAEHRLDFEIIKKTIEECNKYDLKVVLCANNLKEVKKFIQLKPWAIAYEDPQLISTGKSITKYDKENLKKFVKILKKKNIISICGAGISSFDDFLEAGILGCEGVLIASAIAKKNPNKFLRKLK